MIIPVAIVLMPFIIGCIAALLGIGEAFMIGIAVSILFICMACVILIWETAGFLAALGGVVFASMVAAGVWTAQQQENHAVSEAHNVSKRSTSLADRK